MNKSSSEQGPRFGVFPSFYEPALRILRNEGGDVREKAISEHPGLFVSAYEHVDENSVFYAFEFQGKRYAIHELAGPS